MEMVILLVPILLVLVVPGFIHLFRPEPPHMRRISNASS